MKTSRRPRFDLDALRAFAGEKVFARGEAYHRDGQVRILAIEPARVLAQVLGTEEYRAALTGRGREIGGECSCPAFGDWGFCKHMVATALAANAAEGDPEAAGAGALSRIRAHLKGKGVDALVELIVGLAECDPALFRKLDVAASALDGDDKTLGTRLRKAIDEATLTRGYVEYREAEGWAAEVDGALDALAELAANARASLALELAEHAIDRIERAIDEIDDSDGHCGALMRRARDIHLAAARAARPDPVRLARTLFACETESDYDTFAGAAGLYAEILGETGLSEYRRLATEAWGKLPTRSGKSRLRDGFDGSYRRLSEIIDFFAEREGDLDARIALRAKDLSSPWRYLQLAEFCLEHGREEEALSRAEEGLWAFEDDRPDERLVLFAVGLLAKRRRRDDAKALLQRSFEKAPSFELYARLRKLGGKAARDHAIACLEARLATNGRASQGFLTDLFLADLLIRILTQEKAFEAAWGAVRKHGASAGTKEALARASETAHPREALAVYAERVHALAESGGNPAYAEAAGLVAHMAALQSPTEQADYVAALKERFGRRRNFMKRLA